MGTDWAGRPIDTTASDETLRELLGNDEAARSMASERVIANPERFNPQVFYGLSARLVAEERHEDAMFWFYTGQLRARFDANRCTDELAGVVVGRLNDMFGPAVNRYAFQHLDLLESTVGRVLEFDRATAHEYDPRWINRGTPGAMTAAMAGQALDPTTMTRPADEWPAIAERTRTEYAAGFAEALRKARASASEG
ncbi:MAG: hypothetical protein GX596_06040 [Propionibacterium sp.]|nr:hypothetical protein [Propionibacterium sp.]